MRRANSLPSIVTAGTPVVDDVSSEMVRMAKTVLEELYWPRRHELCAVVRDENGHLFAGVNLKAGVGRASVCAEGASLANAITGRSSRLTHVCTVHQIQGPPTARYRLVPPCGVCRELLMDFAPGAGVILGELGSAFTLSVEDLLPHPYRGLNEVSNLTAEP